MKYLNEYIEEMKQTKSELTVKNHLSTLNKFFSGLSVEEPTEVIAKDVMKFKKSLLAKGTTGSANTQLKRVKKFFKWCIKKSIIDISPADEISFTNESEPLPKWLTDQQEDLLIRSVRKHYLGSHLTEEKKSYRELAIIMMMLKGGLRVSEVCGLKWSDVEINERKGSMLIRGKHDQQRKVPIISELLKVMKLYVEKHGTKGEYVFFSQKNDLISTRTVQHILKQFKGLSNGLTELEEITPHMLRHTFAHNLANGGLQLEAVARVLGHTKKDGTPNIQQTIRYTKSSDDEIAGKIEDILTVG